MLDSSHLQLSSHYYRHHRWAVGEAATEITALLSTGAGSAAATEPASTVLA